MSKFVVNLFSPRKSSHTQASDDIVMQINRLETLISQLEDYAEQYERAMDRSIYGINLRIRSMSRDKQGAQILRMLRNELQKKKYDELTSQQATIVVHRAMLRAIQEKARELGIEYP